MMNILSDISSDNLSACSSKEERERRKTYMNKDKSAKERKEKCTRELERNQED